jgi:hypothetical protein
MKATLYTNLKPKLKLENRSKETKNNSNMNKTNKNRRTKSNTQNITPNKNQHRGLKTH